MGFLKSRLFAVLLMLIGAVMMYAGARNSRHDRLLDASGVETLAIIESIHWKEGRSGRRGAFTGHIAFELPNGQQVKSQLILPEDLGRSLQATQVAEPIRVRYVPTDTRVVRMAQEVKPRSDDRWLGLGLLLGGALLFVWRMRSRASAG